jgi:hypothetical protein
MKGLLCSILVCGIVQARTQLEGLLSRGRATSRTVHSL